MTEYRLRRHDSFCDQWAYIICKFGCFTLTHLLEKHVRSISTNLNQVLGNRYPSHASFTGRDRVMHASGTAEAGGEESREVRRMGGRDVSGGEVHWWRLNELRVSPQGATQVWSTYPPHNPYAPTLGVKLSCKHWVKQVISRHVFSDSFNLILSTYIHTNDLM